MTQVLSIRSHSEEETLGLAEKLGLFLKGNDTIILTGPMGAGKTAFVRGLARALKIDVEMVNSPTFTIVNEYKSREKALFHFDLYRVEKMTELREIGWDDYLSRDGIVVVEWGEKAKGYLPFPHYHAEFTIVDETTREIVVSVVSE